MSKKRTTVYTPVETKYDIGDIVDTGEYGMGRVKAIAARWSSPTEVEVRYEVMIRANKSGPNRNFLEADIKGRLVYED